MTDVVAALVPGQVTSIPVALLQPDPTQPRKQIDKTRLEELALSIKERGLQQPITIRRENGKAIIKHGERRWRAAQLAKVESVPCVLDARQQTALERGLDQVAENAAREDLNPIDKAEWLARLRDVEKKPLNEIVEIVGKSGIGEMSRSHISNTIRLKELPDWSKEMIRAGTLPPGHGKYLLMAPAIKEVQERLQDVIKDELDYTGNVTGEDVERFIVNVLRDTQVHLNPQWGSNAALFDLKVCKDCKFHHQVGKERFCLSRPEFEKKQTAARDAIKANPKLAPKADQEAMAREEKWKKEQAKSAAATRERNRKVEITEYVHAKLQAHLARVVLPKLNDRELNLQLTAFLAVGCDNHYDYNNRLEFSPRETAATAMKRGDLAHYLGAKVTDQALLVMAQAAVFEMQDDQLRQLARFVKLSADPLLRIDADYLELLQRQELDELAKKAKLPPVAGLTNKDLKTKLLQPAAIAAIAVPKQLQDLFNEDVDKDLVKESMPGDKEAAEALAEISGIVAAPAAKPAPKKKAGAKK